MAEGTLTLQEIVNTGLTPSMAAATASDGDGFVNDGRTFVMVINGSGAPITVTPDAFPTGHTTPKPDGLTPTDRAISVAAGATKLIGPFPPGIYNRAADGKAKITCSDVTTVTLAALKLVPAQS